MINISEIIRNLITVKKCDGYTRCCVCGIKFKIRKEEYRFLQKKIAKLEQENSSLAERLFKLEMEVVRQSGLWDEEWYIRTYHPQFSKNQALKYYMTEGFKKKEAPSPLVNASARAAKLNREPILDYMLRGRYESEKIYHTNVYPPAETAPQTDKNSKKVVYTCITADYDDIENIKSYYYTDSSWRYVCFTDNQKWLQQKQIGIWEMRPLVFTKLDNTRINRWHKMHPHLLFPECEESIYIDANINILTPKLFRVIAEKNKDILIPFHGSRVDLYEEIEVIKKQQLDNPQIIAAQYELIKASGFPKNYGLFENNIIYRRHHEAEIKAMMNEWWFFIENYCCRDQASLAYIFWQHKRKIRDYALANARTDYLNFCMFTHAEKLKNKQ